jgi:DNA-binding beta-propeller fold protein YncE
MGTPAKILGIDPLDAIAGGEVIIDCAGFDTRDPHRCEVLVGSVPAQIVALGPRRVLAIIPENKGGQVDVRLHNGDESSEPVRLTVARKLEGDLHPVANPAFDPDDGALFVTRSGSRGEELPVTLFRIDISGDVTEYSGDIPNPTGIAFNSEGEMFVTSRLEGAVYKINPFKEAVAFARNLGVATGIAFDREGLMYVGDRTGTIFTVNGIGEERAWAQIEPSVSAFHLAFGPDDALYVTGPTVTSSDCIWRIDPDGEIDVFFKGLGRPQGLAFDTDGNLYVAASLGGRRGIVRISPNGRDAKVVVAGVNLIGVAFSSAGEMAVVSIDSVYSLPMQVKGTLLTG